MQQGPSRLVEWGSYLAVALVAVSAALLGTGRVVGDGIDLYGTLWFYWFTGRCIETLSDPTFTDLFFYPLGKDVFAHTGANLVDAVVAWPFQALLPYPRYQPWFIAFLMLGNAATFRPLARHLLETRWAVWGATLLWEVTPFALSELANGRPTQAFLWFLPLAVLCFLRVGEQVRSGGPFPWRPALAAGALTACQAWTYWFMGHFMALMFGWLALVDLVETRGRRTRIALAWLVSIAVAAILVGPAVVLMAARASTGQVPALAAAVTANGLPDSVGLLDTSVAAHLNGYWLQETDRQPLFGYLVWGGGVFLWLVLGRMRRRWAVVFFLALAFAIGPSLSLGSGQAVPMPHYLAAYQLVPFLGRLWFPYRLVVIAFLAASLGIGTLIDRFDGWRLSRAPRLAGWLLPVLLLATTMGEQHRFVAFPLPTGTVDIPPIYPFIGRVGGAIIELPLGVSRTSIALQPVHGQPTFGGMGEDNELFWPPGYDKRLKNSFVRFLQKVSRDPADSRAFNPNDEAALRAEGYRWLILDRRLFEANIGESRWAARASPVDRERAPFIAVDTIEVALGPPAAIDGPLVIWDLVGGAIIPAELQPSDAGLTERTWEVRPVPEYVARLRSMGRLRDPMAPLGGRARQAGQ